MAYPVGHLRLLLRLSNNVSSPGRKASSPERLGNAASGALVGRCDSTPSHTQTESRAAQKRTSGVHGGCSGACIAGSP